MSKNDNVQFMEEEEAAKPKKNNGRRRKPADKPKEIATVDAQPEPANEEVSDFTMADVQPIAVQEDPPEDVEFMAPVSTSTSEALQAVLAARDGEGLDEWDMLMVKSEDKIEADIPRMTLGMGGFFYKDDNGDKQLYAAEVTGVVIAFTEPRNDWLGDGDGSLPPFCSSPDGIFGTVLLPEDEDDREELLELAEDQDTKHPIIHLRASGEDVIEWKGKCKECPRSRWRSANGESRAQACKPQARLLVIPDNEDRIIAISIPPTSLGIWDKYIKACGSSRKSRAYYWVKTKLGFKPRSSGNHTWGVLTLENMGHISEHMEKGKALAFGKAIMDLQAAARTEALQMAAKSEDYFV